MERDYNFTGPWACSTFHILLVAVSYYFIQTEIKVNKKENCLLHQMSCIKTYYKVKIYFYMKCKCTFCIQYTCGLSVFTATTTYNFVAGQRKLFQAGCTCWIPGGVFCVAVSWLAGGENWGPVKGRPVSSFRWNCGSEKGRIVSFFQWKLWPREGPFCFYFFQPSSGLAMLTISGGAGCGVTSKADVHL
jgi:hypothetical protein